MKNRPLFTALILAGLNGLAFLVLSAELLQSYSKVWGIAFGVGNLILAGLLYLTWRHRQSVH